MNTDYGQKTRTLRLKGKTLSVYRQLNPTAVEFARSQGSGSEYQDRWVGDRIGCCPVNQIVTCAAPDPFTINIGAEYSGGDEYDSACDISWNPVPNSTSYDVSIVSTLPNEIIRTGTYTATAYYDIVFPFPIITVTAINSCGTSDISGELPVACFLAGSLVTMADGTLKAIEDILVGDSVLGAFGEINTVLALQRPILGNDYMCKINDEHSTTSHHPHISVDKKFYCNDISLLDDKTYSRHHEAINENGEVVLMFLHGLRKGRTQQLVRGVELKTAYGSKRVDTIETYSLPPDTQLYNLAIGGSHTYHVDGYAVTGWPREDDFDYDSWTPKETK